MIAAIYEAALEPELWPLVLAQMGELIGSDVSYRSTLKLPHHARCGGPQLDSDNAALRPETSPRAGGRDLHGDEHAIVLRHPGTSTPLGVLRLTHAGQFDGAHIQTAQCLARHLAQAVRLLLTFGDIRAERDAAVDALNHLALGVVLVDAAGQVLLLNRAAENIIGAKAGLAVRQGRLRAAKASDTSTLHRLIAGAAADGAEQGLPSARVMALGQPSEERTLSVLVVPVRPDVPLSIRGQPAAAVFISDPEAAGNVPEDLLARLYELTPAEARITGLLLQGRSMEQVAERLGVSGNTARTHLKRVFEKTGVRRQSDLVGLLLRTPAGILRDSVRKAANRARSSAHLTDGTTGGQLWAEHYDRVLEDIFRVQDEVTRHASQVTPTREEQRRMARKGTSNPEAYDWYLRGRELTWRMDRQAPARARPMLERAVQLDSRFAVAYSMLSMMYTLEYINFWSDSPERSAELSREFAQKALELDASDPMPHVAMALVFMWKRQHGRAIAEAESAVALEPNHALAYSVYASALHYAGRSQEALGEIETAMRLDPHYPDLWLHFLGQIYFMLERYEEAVAALQRRLIRFPDTDISRVLLASCYGHLGRIDEAKTEWSTALQINPEYSLDDRLGILPYADPADLKRMVLGLRKAGLPD